MGGFTKIRLRDTSIENIRRQNLKLRECGVAKKYHFYSDDDIRIKYLAFREGKGEFKPEFFPPHLINTFNDFKKFWSPSALGEIFVPKTGTLVLNSYFGRISSRAMNRIARYLLINLSQIKEVGGSFSTFVERCGYGKKSQKCLLELNS